ncbi:hypothetical protein CTAYLR_007784 [Chrysophaeum taylorii]|uniref:Autophagy-related protein 101 n=1 Tax=Chrysophaeum taylorii TaxID=2483200 RepID=A0AAD7UJS8_9STRA|nr:hypothetical protein CTAYLR_007784 [Chrysophaeum taylorii]
MSNVKEFRLNELELWGVDQAREALLCVLHTILFCRAPGPFRPQTVHAKHFDLAYSRVGVTSVTRAVERAVTSLTSESLVPAGPELLKGAIVLSFFERRRSRSLFGLVSNEEKVVWEQWTTPVLVSTRPRDHLNPTDLERRRARYDADLLLRRTIADVHTLVNGPLDHVPSSMYEFEILPKDNAKLDLDKRDAAYARVMLNPPLHQLGAL